MKLLHSLRRIAFRLAQKLLFTAVRSRLIGSDARDFTLDFNKPVVYALLFPSLAERLLIDREVQQLGWMNPQQQRKEGILPGKGFFSLYRRSRVPLRRLGHPIVDNELVKNAQWILEQDDRDIQIVPIRVFWGKAPNKESSVLKTWLHFSGTLGGRLSTVLAVLLNGRNTYVHLSRPLSMRELVSDNQTPEMLARKVARVLRVHNRQVTASVIGPDLSHRRTLVHKIPRKPLVLKAIEEEVATKGISKEKAQKRALKYADEIASNISYTNIRFLDVLLTWVWNKIYDGVSVHNIHTLKDASKDNEIIYVPCHRSHIDYLLLSYVLFHQGLQLPQIAAGINLNMPIVGAILRRGGAFFMRRTFRDNKLYAAVFDEYLHSVFTQGYATEYFVEGGRSRTGRTLNPKAGMLGMTVRSYLRDSRKPIILVPVYTGYEKVFEANSYLGELRGQKKKKESLLGVLGTLRAFKRSFGKVNVTFGDPIYLTDFLNESRPNWREEEYESVDFRPEWAPAVVDQLAKEVVVGINHAASVNPINLLALSILTAPRQAMDERQLANHMEAYRDLLAARPYSHLTVVPEGQGQEWVHYGEKLDAISRTAHPLGDLLQTDDRQSVILTYYRNNVLHLYALPSLLACLFIHNQRFNAEQVQDIVQRLYPYLQAELFLRWQPEELATEVQAWLDILVAQGYLMLNNSGYHAVPANNMQHAFLEGLAGNMMQTLERYFLTLSVLRTATALDLTAQTLEERCTLLAQRISLLYGINAPEFFDKALFRSLITQLKVQGLLHDNGDHLSYSPELDVLAEILDNILDGDLRQSILRSLK